jgi:LemA protein
MKGLDGFFSKLIATYENYPQLKSSELYLKLMDENKLTENRVNIARTDFNELVRDYNILVTTFPNAIVARMFNCEEKIFFEVDSEEYNKAPRLFVGTAMVSDNKSVE